MPELPEVETVARQLGPVLCGRRVRQVTVLDPRLGDPPVARLRGLRVKQVLRMGKRVVLELEGPRRGCFVAVHLRMTGRLVWRAGRGAVQPRHLRARFDIEGGRLLFYDPRRFGTLVVAQTAEPLAPVGIDPLSPTLGPQALADLLRGSRQPIKSWLLRQDRLVGLGNIYASEILHQAGIDPRRVAGGLHRPRIARLHAAMRNVLRRAIESCGTTFSDFQDAHGLTGSYQHYLGVYGREGQPCPRCGRPIRRIVQQQRSSFYCSGCQR